jgi:hypothetical protein
MTETRNSAQNAPLPVGTDSPDFPKAGPRGISRGRSRRTRDQALAVEDSRQATTSTAGAGSHTNRSADITRSTSTRSLAEAPSLRWELLSAGPLPRTRCCEVGCAQCVRVAPPTWQPLPFEVSEDPQPTTDPLSPRPADSQELSAAATILRLCAEMCWGLRSPHQSIRWTTRSAYEYLCRRHSRARAVRAGQALAPTVTILGVRAQIIDGRVMECSAVVLSRSQTAVVPRAIAVRAVARDSSWWVTHVEL